jgi:hypothetical protein
MEIATIYLYTGGQIKFKTYGKNVQIVLETNPIVIRVLEPRKSHIEKNVVADGHPTPNCYLSVRISYAVFKSKSGTIYNDGNSKLHMAH